MKFCIAAFVDKGWPETDKAEWLVFVMPAVPGCGGSQISGYSTPSKQVVFCEGPFDSVEDAEKYMAKNLKIGGWV